MGISKKSSSSPLPASRSPMSLGPKSTPSLSTLTMSSPITATDSLLRVARRAQELPPSPGSSIAGLFATSAAQGGPLGKSALGRATTISPGEANYDPLENPITPYPVQTMGVPAFRHEEFGWCANQDYRHTSKFSSKSPVQHASEEPPYYVFLTTYISYLILISIGHLRDFFGKKFYPTYYKDLIPHDGYAALNSDFDSFYTRRLKTRLDDCFGKPVTGVPGRSIVTFDRTSDDSNLNFKYSGERTRCLNVSSYNYLGFAAATGGCADAVEESIRRYGVSAAGPRLDAGTLDLHVQAEQLVARFLGKDDAMVVSMGFATNSTTLPALVGKGCLVISDELNHSSIRFGTRLSGAAVRSFKHNDMKDLEKLLREVISQGQPRTHRPWKKILVIVEGIYSMEGNLVDLPILIQLKAKYKFYLYVDEAHSIGGLGPNGRGVCDYFGIHPSNVDILMGTLTKSFGAAGGYIAADKATIDRLRLRSHAAVYAESISPAVLTQIIAALGSIMGVSPPLTPSTPEPIASPSGSSLSLVVSSSPATYGPAPSTSLPTWLNLPPALLNGTEGRERLRRLAFNARYLSTGLRKMGFIVWGHRDSPIVPMLTFNPAKMPLFSRMMVDRMGGEDQTPIVTVVVGYPATPLVSSRVRFCVSASHTKDDIDLLLRACDEVGTVLDLKHGKPEGGKWKVEDVIAKATELVLS